MQKKDQSDADKWLFEGFAHDAAGRVEKAVSAFRKAAQAGDPTAQVSLGNLLDDKIKRPQPKEAVYWYKRAVRAGSHIAAYNLAIHYRSRGGARWSKHWFEVAIKMGDPDAPAELRKLNRKPRRTRR